MNLGINLPKERLKKLLKRSYNMINKFIIDTLSSDSEVTDIVGDRIYPIIAPEDVKRPFIVFTVNSIDSTYSKTSNESLSTVETAFVNIVESTYDDMSILKNKVIKSLELEKTQFINIEEGYVMGSTEGEFFTKLTISKFFIKQNNN